MKRVKILFAIAAVLLGTKLQPCSGGHTFIAEIYADFSIKLLQKIIHDSQSFVIFPPTIVNALFKPYPHASDEAKREMDEWFRIGTCNIAHDWRMIKSMKKRSYDRYLFAKTKFYVPEIYMERSDPKITHAELAYSMKCYKQLSKIYPIQCEKVEVFNKAFCRGLRWKYPFYSENVNEIPFYTAVDKSSTCRVAWKPVMYADGDFPNYKDDQAEAIAIPYEDSKLHMLIIVPKKNIEIAEFVRQFTGQKLLQYFNNSIGSSHKLSVRMPKFSFRTKLVLNKGLSQLGMQSAFSEAAKFSSISDFHPFFIAGFQHLADIRVNEYGTGFGMENETSNVRSKPLPAKRSCPSEFIVERSFLFAFVDDEGKIGYIGHYTGYP